MCERLQSVSLQQRGWPWYSVQTLVLIPWLNLPSKRSVQAAEARAGRISAARTARQTATNGGTYRCKFPTPSGVPPTVSDPCEAGQGQRGAINAVLTALSQGPHAALAT